MPNQDQTGPTGQGPTTGRGQGRCQNSNQTSTNQDTSFFGALRRRFRAGQQGQRKGRGNGRGQGSGFRNQSGRW